MRRTVAHHRWEPRRMVDPTPQSGGTLATMCAECQSANVTAHSDSKVVQADADPPDLKCDLSSIDCDTSGLSVLVRIASSLEKQVEQLRRIADHCDPTPPDIVDSVYAARRLDCTTSWIAQMVRRGEIPTSCIVVGSGNGKRWKFYRSRIEEWLEQR